MENLIEEYKKLAAEKIGLELEL